MTLSFPAGIATDTDNNSSLAKTITIGIDDPKSDTEQKPVIVDVVDPIWKVENVRQDTENKKVTLDLIATDKYLTGVDNSTLTTDDITVIVNGDENANNLIKKALSEPKFSANRTTGLNEIKYTLTLENWEESAKQAGKNFLEYSGSTQIKINAGTITDNAGGAVVEPTVKPSEVFDANGTNSNGLHIGDFIDYDAGTWKSSEINSIKTGLKTNLQTANGKKDTPSYNYQFGGYSAGSSRNENAVNPYSSEYDYIKDASTNKEVTGWRVFDIDGDTITLISAGNPEDYRLLGSSDDGREIGAASEYILTGNVTTQKDLGMDLEWNEQEGK